MDEFEKKARELPQHRFVHDAIPEIAQALREAVEAERDAMKRAVNDILDAIEAQAIRNRGQ